MTLLGCAGSLVDGIPGRYAEIYSAMDLSGNFLIIAEREAA
jgi:hypothetical protein